MRGIDADEVASFLGRVADELAMALDANVKLEEQLEAFQAEINDYQAKEREFSTAILSAYKTSTDMKTRSEEEAKTLLAGAHQEAKALRETVAKEAKALQEKAAREVEQLRQAAQQETTALKEKITHEMAELRAAVHKEVEGMRQEAQQETDALTAMTITEIDAQRAVALKETETLLEQGKQEIVTLREQTQQERTQIEAEINELKSLRTKVQNQMREMLRSYMERLEAVGKELGEAPPPPPAPVKKPAPPAPKPAAPRGDLDDLTAATGDQPPATGKNLTAMDVDDLTGLYEKIDISDLGEPGGLVGNDLESLVPEGNHDLSLDDPFEDLAPAKPRGGGRK